MTLVSNLGNQQWLSLSIWAHARFWEFELMRLANAKFEEAFRWLIEYILGPWETPLI